MSTWIVSGAHLSIILSIRWAYSRSRSSKVTRSRKGGNENVWRCAAWQVVLGKLFVNKAKNDPRTLFFEWPKSDNFENRENTEIAGNSVKMPFSTLKAPKPGHFSRYLPEMLNTYTPGRALSHIFWQKRKLSPLFEKKMFFGDYFFKDCQNFQNFWNQI